MTDPRRDVDDNDIEISYLRIQREGIQNEEQYAAINGIEFKEGGRDSGTRPDGDGSRRKGNDMPRITYKSQFGDYGINQEWENLNEFELIHLLANKLGNYEDLGTVEELKALKEETK